MKNRIEMTCWKCGKNILPGMGEMQYKRNADDFGPSGEESGWTCYCVEKACGMRAFDLKKAGKTVSDYTRREEMASTLRAVPGDDPRAIHGFTGMNTPRRIARLRKRSKTNEEIIEGYLRTLAIHDECPPLKDMIEYIESN